MVKTSKTTLEQTALDWFKAIDRIVEWLAKRIPGGEA